MRDEHEEPSEAEGGPFDAERLRRAVQIFVRRFGLLLAGTTPCGQPMATSHAHALMWLLGEERPVRQHELAEALCIDKSNVTRLCVQMEEKGQVTQRRASRDGRGRLVCLTSRGARVAGEVRLASEQRFERLLARIPQERRALVFAGLSALNAALVEP